MIALFRLGTSPNARLQVSPHVPALNIRGATLAAATVFLLGGFGPNYDVALWSAGALFFGTAVLWRRGEFPLLLFIFLQPWLQASTSIFHSNYLGIDLQRYSDYGGDMGLAVTLSLIGLVAMAIGMRLGAGRLQPQLFQSALAIAKAKSLSQWFKLYLIAAILCYSISAFSWVSPGLAQFILAIANLKWAFFFMLALAAMARGAFWSPYFILPFFGEFILSLGEFFSEFKTVFIFSLLAFSASSPRINIRNALGVAIVASLLLTMGAIWSSVKSDYRTFISRGSREQVVVVDYETRLSKLASMINDLDGAALASGFDKLFRRVSYVEFFASELYNIPNFLPFQNGVITADAVLRPFMPRLFFPEKDAIDDTARTRQLTGVKLQYMPGTSISVGYVGEFYADFGVPGMFAALLVVGGLYGGAFRWLMTAREFAGPLGMGLACAVLMQVGAFDSSFTKIFGGLVVSLVACWVIARFVVRRYCPWLLLRP